MVLQQIEILNFKSIAYAQCSFAPKLNCFLGGNGMGKTNLLDAIHYLSMLRSHIGTTDPLAIQYGTSEAIISASYNLSPEEPEEHIALRIRHEQGKALSRNGRPYKRLSQHIGRYPLVIISPQDQTLIRGGSMLRRAWLDRLLSQQNPQYLDLLIRYETALKQRNALLKKESRDELLYLVVEEQMAHLSCAIAALRRSLVEQFIPSFDATYQAISQEQSEAVSLRYVSQITDSPQAVAEEIQAARAKDLILGHSSVGIHKDDLEMLLGENLMRKVGSEGQNKTFLTALKFTEYKLIAEALRCQPILLLDDLFDKLDAERVERIIGIISQSLFGQTFITDTNRKYLDDIIAMQHQSYSLFSVSHGEIALQSSSGI